MSVQPPKRRFIDEDDEDVQAPPKKKAHIEDDEPAPRKKTPVEDEDEAPKKRRQIEDDDEPAPKSQVQADEEEDTGPIGMDVDFGDERVAYKKARIERIKLEEGSKRVIRLALLPGFKAKAAPTHFIPDKGTIICLSTPEGEAECCQKLNYNPQTRVNMRILALAVEYTNAKKDGTLPKDADGTVDIEWEVKYLRMSRKNYNEIFKLAMGEDGETVYDFDIGMSHSESGIGFEFHKISKTAWWRKDPALEAEILEVAEKFRDGKDLGKALGRKVDALELKTLLWGGPKKGKGDDEDEI